MNLVIDIGNSATKIAIFNDKGSIIDSLRYSKLTIPLLDDVLAKYNSIIAAISSSVGDSQVDLCSYFKTKGVKYIEVTSKTPMPIINSYATPETLGVDRLVAAVGGMVQFPNRELLVVDLGSAITIDRVSADGVFLGGNISPGMEMRFKALHIFTSKLKLCSASDFFSYCGKNSEEAIIGGVIMGIIYELDGYINTYKNDVKNISIIFTGGDAKYFENKLKNAIFASCETLLIGLNKILEYNIAKR